MNPGPSPSPTTLRRRIGILGACVAILCGCASIEPDDRSPTGGRSLSIQHWEPSEGKVAYYEIDREGVFGCSGGIDAEVRQVTWSTALDASDLARLLDPPARVSWWDRLDGEIDAASSDPAANPSRTLIRFVGPGVERERRVRGPAASIEPLLARMREIAMGRFAQTLDALPRAGERFPD